MKNQCQNYVNIEPQVDSNLGPILERFGGQVGAQVEAKMHPKPIENSFEILMNFEVVMGRARGSGNTGGDGKLPVWGPY